MAGYRKAKEIYMFHRNVNDEITIIPIRGLYVSGTHYDPVFEDHNMTITQMTSDGNISIVDFTEVSHNITDPSGDLFIDTTWNTSLTVTDYHITSLSHDDTATRFINATWETLMTITEYQTVSVNHDDTATRMIYVDWNTVMNISPKPEPVQPDTYQSSDHNVSILEMSSTNSTIITEGS